MFDGAFSWIWGAPSETACSASTTTGSGSQSTSIRASASSAVYRSSATTTATPAPRWVTRSISSTRGVLTLFSAPVTCHAHGSGFRCSKSFPVNTPTTPGAVRAFSTSIERMRAWANGERRTAACVIPGRLRSSKFFAAPVMSRGSSTRLTDSPIRLVVIVPPPRVGRPLPGLRGRCSGSRCSGRDCLRARDGFARP